MSRAVRIPTTTRVDVECAIARGWRIERICDRLDLPPELVQSVWNSLDENEREDPDRAAGRVAAEAFKVWQAWAAKWRRALAEHQNRLAA